MPVRSTVIGSFPHVLAEDQSNAYGKIGQVIDLQVKYGIDYPCDGQLRDDMNAYFAKAIEGLALGDDCKPRIVGNIDGIRSEGLERIIKDLKYAKKRLASGESGAQLKANITGPVTLINAIPVKGMFDIYNFYTGGLNDPKLWEDIGRAQGKIFKRYEEAGIRHIQMDDPVAGMPGKSWIPNLRAAIESMDLGRLNSETKIYFHSCGDIRERFKEIAGLDFIEGLAFEFAGSPQNFEVLTKEALESNEEYPKRLILGVVNSQVPEPDRVIGRVTGRGIDDEMAQEAMEPYVMQGLLTYALALDKAGQVNIPQITLDCGVGGHRCKEDPVKGVLIAETKLAILQEVKYQINSRGELYQKAMQQIAEKA